MPSKREITLELNAKIQKLEAKLKEAEAKVEYSKNKMIKANDSLTASFSRLGGVIGVTFGAQQIVSFVKQSIDLYAKQEAAEKRLSVAYGKNIGNLKEYAAALQRKTAFGDEDIIDAQALIAAFVKEEEAINQATEASLDLAAALGMNLKDAASLVAKTLGSTTNALSRYGIEVTGAVDSNERLESLLTNINDKFGGQAQAQLETYTGKVQALSNAWGDMLEILGKISVNTIFAGMQTMFSSQSNGPLMGLGFGMNITKNLMNEDLKNFFENMQEEYKSIIPNDLGDEAEINLPDIKINTTKAKENIKAGFVDFYSEDMDWFQEILDEQAEVLERENEIRENRLNSEELYKQLREEAERQRLEEEQYYFDLATSNAARLGYALEDAFSGHGETLLSYMNQALQVALGISRALNQDDGSLGGALGVAASIVPGLGLLGNLFKAEGGPVSASSTYIVGEKGPELFTPKTSGYIVPNNQLGSNNNLESGKLDALNMKLFDLIEVNKMQLNKKQESTIQGSNIVTSYDKSYKRKIRYT